jgi:hypothetical protein
MKCRKRIRRCHHFRLMRSDPLWPPMEPGSALDLLALSSEGDALGGDFFFEIRENGTENWKR